MTYYLSFQTQQLFGWSPLSASLHCLPIGIAGGISSYLSGLYGPRLPRKLLLPGGQLLMAIAAILFALSDTPSKYWSHTFVAMIIGMLGTGIAYVGVMVAVMASAPKGEEGVISALLNTAFQLGATIGLATKDVFFSWSRQDSDLCFQSLPLSFRE